MPTSFLRSGFRLRPLAVLMMLSFAGCGGDDDPPITPPPSTGVPVVVDDLAAVVGTSSSLTVRWTAPTVTDGEGPVTAYDLRAIDLGQEDAAFAAWPLAPTPPAPAAPGTVQEATCTGLTAGRAYVLRLRATVDGETWSGLSNLVVASADPTLDLTPPAAVDGLTLLWRTATECEAEWTTTGDDVQYGAATSYELRLATAPIDAQNWERALAAGTVRPGSAPGRRRATAAGLAPTATYYAAVRATDDAGNLGAPCPSLTVAPAGPFIRVAADGSGDQPTIGAALAVADAGDIVLVGPGRYTWSSEGGGMDPLGMFTFGRGVTAITLVSEEGPATTILDAEGQGRVLFAMAHNDGVVIDGFTITGGVPTAADGETPKAGGLLFHLTDLTVRNCVFTGNHGGQGGAIYYGGRGRPLLENCVISGNTADLIGGGIFLINSPGEQGTAVDAPILRGCTITGNSAPRGGGVFAYDIVLHLEDCLIADNVASEAGGGLYIAGYGIPEQPGVGTEMVRCTVAGNRAPDGAGLRLATALPTPTTPRPGNLVVTGCLFFGNQDDVQLVMSAENQLAIGCSLLFGGLAGDDWPAGFADAGGNVAADPRFCDPARGDYGLLADSPAAPGQHPDGADCGQIGARPVGCR